MFHSFLMRNPHLTLLNKESICQGLITRSRKVNGRVENSILDFVIVCDKLIPFVSQFIIDEQKMYALANYSSKCNQKYSDHNSIITKFSLTFHGLKPERRHIYNFKNEEGFLKFKSLTAANGRFSNIFNNIFNISMYLICHPNLLNLCIWGYLRQWSPSLYCIHSSV